MKKFVILSSSSCESDPGVHRNVCLSMRREFCLSITIFADSARPRLRDSENVETRERTYSRNRNIERWLANYLAHISDVAVRRAIRETLGESISSDRRALPRSSSTLHTSRLMMSLTRARARAQSNRIAKPPARTGYAPGINYSAPSFRTKQSGAIHANEYEYGIATPRANRVRVLAMQRRTSKTTLTSERPIKSFHLNHYLKSIKIIFQNDKLNYI